MSTGSLFQRQRAKPARLARRLAIEALESRWLMAGLAGSGGAAKGDFDADADVDGADFLVWQRGLADASSADALPGGPSSELLSWQADFGRTIGPISPEAADEAFSEPVVVRMSQGSLAPAQLHFGDVNGDSLIDAIFFDSSAETRGGMNRIRVGLNDGGGQFRVSANDIWWEHGASSAGMLQIADVNGDGMCDAVYFDTSRSGGVWVGLSDGASFRGAGSGQWWEHGPSTPDMLQLADVNGDGASDAIYFDTLRSGGVWVGLSDGASFRGAGSGQWWEHGPSTPDMLQLADVNGDGRRDAIYFDTSRSRGVWVGLSDGASFRAAGGGAWWVHGESTPAMLQFADVNGDGSEDAIYFDVLRSGGVWVGISDGASFYGTGGGRWWEHGYSTPDMIQFADVTGDGLPDALYFDITRSGGIWVGVNVGSSFRGSGTGQWLTHGPSTPDMIQYADIDGDGRADALYFDVSRSEQLWGAPAVTRMAAGQEFVGSFEDHGVCYDPKVIAEENILCPASIPVWNESRTAITSRNAGARFNPFLWAVNGYQFDDILQGDAGMCTIAAALASAANQGIDLAGRIRYLGGNTYDVLLFEHGWQSVDFDGRVYAWDLQPKTTEIANADNRQTTRLAEYWPLLFGRAYLQAQGVNWSIAPGQDDEYWENGFLFFRSPWTSPKNASFAVAGGDKNNWDTSEGEVARTHLLNNLALGSVVTVSTLDPRYGGQPSGWNWLDRSIGVGHMWAVLALRQNPAAAGGWEVEIYNPWGQRRTLAWNDFSAGFDTITMVTRRGVAY
jgi:phosphoribosyl-AMP cyclohydrolase